MTNQATTGASAASPTASNRVDRWLADYGWVVVLLLAAVGLVLRVRTAIPTFLNPDEAMNFLSADHRSLAAAYQGGNINPHPPLYYFFLFFWRFVGRSDFILRLPSVLAGTATIWVAYVWMRRALGSLAGLAGAALLAFSPEMVALSAEVRSYALLILLLFAALYFLERALAEGGTRFTVWFGVMQLLAVLIHYGAIWVAVALGLYVLYRYFRSRPRPGPLGAWLGVAIVTAGVLVLLYFIHISQLRGSTMENFARQSWLRSSYFQVGADNIMLFPFRQAVASFGYIFSGNVPGIVALVLTALGTLWLLVRGAPRGRRAGSRRRDLGLLLLLPFVTTCLASVLGLYPFGGTRHAVYLVVFAVPAISHVLSRAGSRRQWPVLAVVLVAAAWWTLAARPSGGWWMHPYSQRRERVIEAGEYIREVTPPGGIVFSDIQTVMVLHRYLCGDSTVPSKERLTGYWETRCGSFLLVRCSRWSLNPDNLGPELLFVSERYGLVPGTRVTVPYVGWGHPLSKQMADAGYPSPNARTFGGNISVQTLVVGDEPLPDSLAWRVRATRDGLRTVVAKVVASGIPRFRAVAWPGRYFDLEARQLSGGLADSAMTYDEFYRPAKADIRNLRERLPALALWMVGSREQHPGFMYHMDNRESYLSAGFLFSLLAVDSTGMVAAYAIEPEQ